MFIKETLYSYNDVMVKPAIISEIKHRSECNPFKEDRMLPIFTAPMSTVVNERNYHLFERNGIHAIYPRNIDFITRYNAAVRGEWAAFSLKEFKETFCNEYDYNYTSTPYRVLIDVANGHMKELYDAVRYAKKIHSNGNKIEIMIGNIANPLTYRYACEAGVDMIRVGIGGGSGCITSSNLGVHYPMASLIDEIYKVKNKLIEEGHPEESLTKIIADGGIRNYSDVIKSLALGADYVMIGSVFASLIESAAKTFTYDKKDNIVLFDPLGTHEIRHFGDYFDVNDGEHILFNLHKVFYGMASREGQIDLDGQKTKTSEGIKKVLDATTNIDKWVENMIAYLRSAMSYTNVKDIEHFCPEFVDVIHISENTKNSINK